MLHDTKLFAGIVFLAFATGGQAESTKFSALEEVIVTAQKRATDLQDTPIAISAIGGTEIKQRRLYSLDAFYNGEVPGLQVAPYGTTSTTVVGAIRGNGPADVGPITREGGVAYYVDGVYLSLPQGLTVEMGDLDRMEVLRGPQGTLVGRDATGGAVHFWTKKPTGEFGIDQGLSFGNYGALRSATHLDLASVGGVRTKLDFVHSERDGWVKNGGGDDYGGYEKSGGRLRVNYDLLNNLNVDYIVDASHIESTQNYPQIHQNLRFAILPNEKERLENARFDLPLSPTVVRQVGHALTAKWQVSDDVSLTSITAYRELDEDTRSNWGGAFYANGLMVNSEIDHEQFTQEILLLGQTGAFEWTAGAFYLNENGREDSWVGRTIDLFADPIQIIDPPVVFPASRITQDSKSAALFAQVTYTPPILEERLHLTAGLRHTEDDKSGRRVNFAGTVPFDIDDRSLAPVLIAAFDLTEDIGTYIKYSSAYRASGVQPRSVDMNPFGSESIDTWELGLKSEALSRRLRTNVALFRSKIQGSQIDMVHPTDLLINETINAGKDIHVSGMEFDVNFMPAEGWALGLAYTYLDNKTPRQQNPFPGGGLEALIMTKAPRHAGAATVDYTFAPIDFGTLAAHLGVTSSDDYAHIASDTLRGSYTLVNGRLSLGDIKLGKGTIDLSLWGRNLTDKEYPTLAFATSATVVYMYGEPRTYGLEFNYSY